jgi:hypothetical protein
VTLAAVIVSDSPPHCGRYSTICTLAEVDYADDSPIRPLPIDPSLPKLDIYSNGAFPSVDGVDLWRHWLTDPTNASAAHPLGLWLSAEVMVRGDYKLVVAQQDPAKTNSGPTLGWKCGGTVGTRCNTTVSAECGENPDTKGPKTPQCDMWVSATPEQCKCGCAFKDRTTPFVPCLFDVASDPSELHDISSSHGDLRTQMWLALNRSNLELYMHRNDTKDPTTDPTANRSPAALVGPCNASCAAAYWSKYNPTGIGTRTVTGVDVAKGFVEAPMCGVPGCSE